MRDPPETNNSKGKDLKGNITSYDYQAEDSAGVLNTLAHERNRTDNSRSTNRNLKRIHYGNRTPYFADLTAAIPLPLLTEWLFEVVFGYGEHDPDTPTPDKSTPWPVRLDSFSIDFTYSYEDYPEDASNPIFSFLNSAGQSGYKRRADDSYLSKSMPPLEFTYSQPIIQEEVREVDPESLENLPVSLTGTCLQWIDLDGEGLSGLLRGQGGCWYYKRNIAPAETGEIPVARFAPTCLNSTASDWPTSTARAPRTLFI